MFQWFLMFQIVSGQYHRLSDESPTFFPWGRILINTIYAIQYAVTIVGFFRFIHISSIRDLCEFDTVYTHSSLAPGLSYAAT